MHYKIAVFR